jgi:HSP20 family molecular chaperone IbpA
MAEKTKPSHTETEQAKESALVERTNQVRTYAPAVDITEDNNNLYIYADMPGADEKTVKVTLENNVLTIEAHVDDISVDGREVCGAEYAAGDYHRVFTINETIERDKIEARIKNGMLSIVLPKAEGAKIKSIPIRVA